MKQLLCLMLMTSGLFGQGAQVPPRGVVPLEVQERAKAAVQAMVDQTVRGNYPAVVATINPKYLKQQARGVPGGVAAVKKQKLQLFKALGKQGVALDATITQRPAMAFEVDLGIERGADGPQNVFRQWMVFVPTVTDFRGLDRTATPPKIRRFRKWGYEIAISPKKGEKWTFINGDGMNPMELRKIFPFLPQDERAFQFPKVDLKEINPKTNGKR